ncbi:uncharacterized protein [Palaemon carinicauda]|uniref:uncharacterized protein n=1 Tax=Palaemon carinicauda TaxID=392227 RepID=UPI0035B5A6BE
MAKLLKPARLDTDPSSSNAAKEWKHWHRTFTNIIEESGDVAPDKLQYFESAIAKLDSVYVMLPNEIFARHVLATRRQQSAESIDEFLRELHELSKDCNFQPVTAERYRQELVRDTFINGIASVFIHQRLLENNSLNMETAHSQGRTLDLAQRSADAYASPSVPHTAALVPEQQAQPSGDQQQHPTQEGAEGSSPGGSPVAAAYLSKRKCYFCGNALHTTGRVSCPTRTATCNKRSKPGHFAKVCKSKVSGSTTATLYNPTLLTIIPTYPNNLSHAATNITVNGHSLKLGVLKDLCCDVILGYDFQKQHQSVTFQHEGKRPSLKITGAKPVCVLATADIDEPSLFPNLPHQCKPIAVKSRRYSQDDQLFIKDPISHLLSEGVIEPSISPWRAQVVVVKVPLDRHKKRLCIDYSQTINQYTELDAYPLPRIEDMVHDLAKYKVFSTFDLKNAYHQFSIKESGASQAEHDENVQKFLEVVRKQNLALNEEKSVISVPTINVLGDCVGNNIIKPEPYRLRSLQELPPPTNMGSLRRAQGLFAYNAKWIPVECDASEVAVSAVLNQGGRPVAFMSRTLQGSELHYPAVEKEATAIIETVHQGASFMSQELKLNLSQKGVATSRTTPYHPMGNGQVERYNGETESPDTTEVQDTQIHDSSQIHDNCDCHESSEPTEIRRSTRVSRPPDRSGWD